MPIKLIQFSQKSKSLHVLNLRMEGDAVLGFYGLDYLSFQAYDFFRRCLSAGIDYDQRLIPVHLRPAKAFALEPALLNHPRCRDLDLVPHLIVRHLVVRAVVLAGDVFDSFKVLPAYHRIAEEASGRSCHRRIRQLCVADVDDGLTDYLRCESHPSGGLSTPGQV